MTSCPAESATEEGRRRERKEGEWGRREVECNFEIEEKIVQKTLSLTST